MTSHFHFSLRKLQSLPQTPTRTSILSLLRQSSCATSRQPAAASETRVPLYLRRARAIDALRLALRRHDPSTGPFPLPSSASLDPFIAAQALRAAPSPDSALSLFRSLSSPSTHAVHALAKSLALARRFADLQSLLCAADDGSSFPNALPPSPMDRLRWYAAAGDLQSSLRVWEAIRGSAAGSKHGNACTESFNLVMGLYVAHGMDADAVRTFSRLIEEGALPNSRTYTVVIEHLVKAGKLEVALRVFERLPLIRVRRTSRQFNVLADGFSSSGQLDEVRKLIVAMRSDGILPGPAMRAAMARLREVGQFEGTDEFADELSPNARIGYVVESCGDTSGDDEGEESNLGNSGGGGGFLQLKPWMDPNALASALSDWDSSEVEALEEAKFVWTSRLVCKLLRGFKKADTAWKFFTWVAYQSEGFTHDRYTVSRMITILARHGHEGLVDRLISKVKAEGILLPFSTVRLVVDFYGISKKPDAALRIFHDVSSVCGHVSDFDRGLLCSSLLRTLVKCKRGNQAMNILERTVSEGIYADIQTFSGLMQFFATEGDSNIVHKLFGIVRQCRIEPDAFMYQVLIQAYIKQGRTALALRTFEDMRNSNLLPDVATKSLLIKSLWDEGKRREVAYVEERSEGIGGGLPVALAGHIWTVSSADLTWIRDIYCNSFVKGSE